VTTLEVPARTAEEVSSRNQYLEASRRNHLGVSSKTHRLKLKTINSNSFFVTDIVDLHLVIAKLINNIAITVV